MLDEAAAGAPRPQALRPFGSVSRGAGGDDTDPPVYSGSAATCLDCADIGATPAERQRIHADMERKLPPVTEYNGPSITRNCEDGVYRNYAQEPVIYR